MSVHNQLLAAKNTKQPLARLTVAQRDEMLVAMAVALRRNIPAILAANEQDVAAAKGKIPDVMIDRLRLTEARVEAMAQGVDDVRALPSPLGAVEQEIQHPNGMRIRKVRVPVGVVAIIYESRPNVTTDAAALCIKSGNVCLLRGSSAAVHTNTVLVGLLRSAFDDIGAPVDSVQLVEGTSRDSATQLMQARGYVDLLIPRGGAGLIRAVVDGARGVPVIETGTGICHVYVDKAADLDMAANILNNAKTSRPSVCNSAEVCLVHKNVANSFLPKAKALLDETGVELRLDGVAGSIIEGSAAGPHDFDTEFLDYILAIKVVTSLDEAIDHVNTHSTGHSDAIVTADAEAAAAFLNGVDSAAVYHNASTRFTDGGEFGLGCEMGISTQKIGARGPMGLYELTSYKYQIEGSGQTR